MTRGVLLCGACARLHDSLLGGTYGRRKNERIYVEYEGGGLVVSIVSKVFTFLQSMFDCLTTTFTNRFR